MLRYFRINDPYRLIGLLGLLGILFLPYFLDSRITLPELKSILIGELIVKGHIPYSELVDSTPPLTAWFYGFVYLLFGKSVFARHLISFFLIFLQSVFFGIMLVNRKVYTENTYVPSLLFAILHLFSIDTLSLTGELLGSGVLLFALNYLFKEMDFRFVRTETSLYLGVLVSIASLLAFQYIVYLPLVCLIVLVFSRRDFNSILLILIGFLLPHILIITGYFSNHHVDAIWRYFYLPNFILKSNWLIDTQSIIILTGCSLIFLVLSWIVLNREARLNKYQSQLFQIVFFWIIFSIPIFFIAKDFRPQSLIPLIPAIAFFLNHFLLFIRKRRFAELSLWTLLLSTMGISLLGRYGYWNKVDYNKLIVNKDASFTPKNQKILVLDNQWIWYIGNSPSSPFLNWELSQSIFSEPDRYESVIQVYDGIINDSPDLIIDTHHYLRPFLSRVPILNSMYTEKEPGMYVRL